jgi:glucose-6-phosphate 1-dehydrogenase
VRGDEAEAAWRIYAPFIEQRPEIHPYEAGTWGPAAAGEL